VLRAGPEGGGEGGGRPRPLTRKVPKYVIQLYIVTAGLDQSQSHALITMTMVNMHVY